MDFDVQVYLLSSKFIEDYSSTEYPELMNKKGRPYSCLLIDLHLDYFICIPFRSHINHRNAYMFKKSQRSKRSRSGLDYSKLVLIKDGKYLDNAVAIVDQDEYSEAMANMKSIVNDVVKYIDNYVSHEQGKLLMHEREFDRLYKFSTLRYFHDILGL